MQNWSRSIVLALAVLFAGPAQAHWENTRWGMTLDEVRRACGAACAEVLPANRPLLSAAAPRETAILARPWRWENFAFDGLLFFANDGQRLSSVQLTLARDGDVEALTAAMRRRYGAPASTRGSEMARVITWRSGDDEIVLVTVDVISATIVIQPRNNQNARRF